MSAPPRIPVLLAPALAADDAMSMDLYLRDLRSALVPFAGSFDCEVVVPPRVHRVGWAAKQWQRYVAYPRLLARRLRARPGAVLHVLDQSYGHLCREDVPTVVSCHGLENFRLKLRFFWQQRLWTYRVRAMRRARRVVAVSGDLAGEVRQFIDVPEERIAVNPYGLDPVFSAAGPSNPILDAHRTAGELLVLHVGVNHARKNINRLLDALARLRAAGLPVRFVKVGYDPRNDGYGEQMERLGLSGHFDYLGRLDAPALAAVYRSCHVLAFPSLHEGFGRPIIEAQACGLPVVVANTASAREIAGTGALIHAPTDVDDLAAKIRAALTDHGVQGDLIKKGTANATRFSWSNHARVLTDVYAQLHVSDPTLPS